METIRSRARELLPQVLLTVLSIIQALALEVLWSSIQRAAHLWSGGFAAVVGWIQVTAVFLGIVVMWLFYVSVALRFRWTPTVRDSAVPFLLGALEFAMAEMLAPELLHWWCWLLAAIFFSSSATAAAMIRDAARDEANLSPALELREWAGGDRWMAAVSVGVPLLAGAAVWGAGPDGWVALLAVLAANGVLLAQAGVIRHYWNLHLHTAAASAESE